MKTAIAIISSLVLGPSISEGADYEPASCAASLPYAGGPLYAGSVRFPDADGVSADPFDAATIQRLDEAQATAMKHTKARAMMVAVASAAGSWDGAKTADGTAAPLKLWWASAGKSFTAVVVMQLAEEGKLSLRDPLARWMPDFPNAAAITIDDLLRHTAGVFSANEDLIVRRRHRYHTPEETIAVAKKHGAIFCPGERWRYSNTGYDMLGRIIEAVEGRPYHEVVAARITRKLGLESLRALAPDERPADVALPTPAGSEGVMQPSWAYAAGAVVGSPRDMITFWRALLAGGLLSRENTRSLFERLYPMFDPGTFYGRGVMLYAFGEGAAQQTWLGHSGGAPGAKAIVAYSPGQQAFVAVALTGDGSAEATANLLLRQLQRPE